MKKSNKYIITEEHVMRVLNSVLRFVSSTQKTATAQLLPTPKANVDELIETIKFILNAVEHYDEEQPDKVQD